MVAVADVFDAMTSERPYRHSMTVGEALSEIVRIAPQKFDTNAVQALLIQVRRDAVGRPDPQLSRPIFGEGGDSRMGKLFDAADGNNASVVLQARQTFLRADPYGAVTRLI